ncbi:hypothetical protein DEJ24_11835 [Curtobacterium sp. MCPF17_001]|uniref:hypothetical protein n=1 Tax=Curtobacterium sp. MCPF17_001 TaxID=2175651 RepID=UPI000DAA8872|nr:hypothetical protein [Curtobacterium sp. MCPF17_001]PZE57263.1 hypothetical protein DEJ24_11835 [Curtobacterium sp. MCPF17_001]
MHDPDHPEIVRLRAELDSAREGVVGLGPLDGPHRDRVVADLLAAVLDGAGRAARAAGREAVVAEIRRFADVEVVTSDPSWPAAGVWADLLEAARQAACGTDEPVR